MTWVKLDTGFFRNPKAASVSRDARILYIAGLCYCGENLTDGVIPVALLRVLASEADVSKPVQLAEELVGSGLWETCERGYAVHDFLEWNKSANRVNEEKAAAQTRMQRHRSREQPRCIEPVTPLQRDGDANVQQPDTDTDTDLSLPDGIERERAQTAPPKPIPKAKPHRLPTDWQPGERELSWAITAGYPEPLIRTETDKFIDHFTASGKTQVDWPAAWRNWLRRSAEFAPKVTPIRAGKPAVDGNLSNEQLEALMRGGAL